MTNCNKCHQDKPDTAFNFNSSKGRLEYHCKECHSEYLKQHYRQNKMYYKEKAARRKQAILDWFREYKRNLYCNRCGEAHPALLDFHHKNPKKKEINLSSVGDSGWCLSRILKEIAKCEVLCCRCHRLHHWNEKWPLGVPESTLLYESKRTGPIPVGATAGSSLNRCSVSRRES